VADVRKPEGSITVLATEDLTAAQRASVIDVCIAAHENDAFRNLFTTFIPSGGRHFLAHRGRELVSHAVVTTRWAQPEGQRALRTAYVDAVSTLPTYQGLGYGTAVMGRMATEIGDYEIACLQTDGPAFYERSGWRSGVGRWPGAATTGWCQRPISVESWCSDYRRRLNSI